MTKKLISMLISILLIFPCSLCFAEELTSAKFINDVEGRPDLSEFLNRDDYEFLSFKVKDVVFDVETNTVTFKNSGKRATDNSVDTNTYVIDNDTAISKSFDDVQPLIDGERNDVTIVIKTEVKNQILDGMNDTVVHVDGLWGSFYTADNTVTDETLTSLLPEDYAVDSSCQRLIEYKIMQGDELGNLNLGSYATRAEMAQFAINVLNMAGIPPYVTPGDEFTDVLEAHWGYKAIMMAKSLGIVNGNGDGTFSPGNFVTYNEAVKMVVEILGYKPEAEKRGGYPEGYGKVATLLGIIGDYSGDSYIPRGDIAAMLEASLDVPLMQQVGYGSKPEFIIARGNETGEGKVTLENNFK